MAGDVCKRCNHVHRGVALTNALELAIEKMDASSAFSLARGMVIHRPGIEWNAAALERYIRRHELSSFGDHAVAAAGGVVGTLVTLAIAKGIRGLWAKYRGP